MTTITSSVALEHLFQNLINRSCDFLVGAGISMIYPSKLPSGNDLKELIINNLSTSKELRFYLNILKCNEKYKQIIPEVIFQDVYSIIGNRIFEVYEVLKLSNPNNFHQLLATFSNTYGANIYTTNFDLLIDRFISGKNNVQHLHGSIDNPNEMTILIHQVGKGVNKMNTNRFQADTRNRNLFVFGYSGNDKDIIDLLNNSKVESIYWMVRDLSDDWVIKNVNRIKNKTFYVFKADLEKFGEEIIRWLKLKVINFRYARKSIEKKAIILKYKSEHSLFERYATLELSFFRIQEYKLAMEISQFALASKVYQNEKELLWLYVAISDAIRIIGDEFVAGLNYIEKGLNLPGINNYPFEKGRLLNIKGLLILEGKKPNPKEAILYFKEAMDAFKSCLDLEKNIIQRLKIEENLAQIHNNLGLSFFELSFFDLAIKEFKNSLKIKNKHGNIIGSCTTQVNLSLCYLKNNNRKTSLVWENKAMQLIKKYNLYYREAFLLREKGIILNNDQGLKMLNIALRIYKEYIPSAVFDIELTLQAIETLTGE